MRERALFVEANGTFSGAADSSAVRQSRDGKLTDDELETLMGLTTESRLSGYRADALPEGETAGYRIVVRSEAQQTGSEGELMDARFAADDNADDTNEVLQFADTLFEVYLPGGSD